MSEGLQDADRYDLQRFVTAQAGTYPSALAELRAGRKTGHWMWFVFPQLAGLGSSAMARHYAVSGLEEARAYLDHPVLGPRLVESAEAVLRHPDRTAEQILGGIDAVKLRSSATLFGRAAGPGGPGAFVLSRVLQTFYAGREDEATVRLLG